MPTVRSGAFPARRAVIRWAWRLLRREWRQQVLVIALLTFTVTAAIFSVSAAYNVVPSQEGRFGTANHRFSFSSEVDAKTKRALSMMEETFGSIEVIGHRVVAAGGAANPIEVRSQNPGGAYSGPMLMLREGRYPDGEQEVALTDEVSEILGAALGSEITMSGTERLVVGLVENPNDLDDEFALGYPSSFKTGDLITVLVETSPQRALSLPESVDVGAVERLPACHATLICLSAGQSERATAAAGVLALATIVMLLVALVAAAGFAVIAQRRLRQLGMLTVVGATERHLRLVVLANGAIVGGIAALLGTLVGIASWVAVGARLEEAAGQRIDPSNLPLGLIGVGILLATATATAAAWSPARNVARIPVTAALSMRPPRPRSVHRSAFVALALLIGGVIALSSGIDSAADRVTPLLVIAGIGALVAGMITISPAAIGTLALCASRLPVAPRLALRDLARYRGRSSAALAAITLGLAIPAAIIVAASAAEYGADEGNLSTHQMLIRVGETPLLIPVRTPDELRKLQSAVERLSATLDEATIVPLQVGVDPNSDEGRGGEPMRAAVVLGRETGTGTVRDLGILYVATPELEEHFDLDLTDASPEVEVLTPHVGRLAFANVSNRKAVPQVRRMDAHAFSSVPTSFITGSALERHGWVAAPAGWFVESSAPLTAQDRADAHAMALAAGVTVETRDEQAGLGALRSGATAIGFLLALGVLSLTVGLVRGEAGSDLRILTATGATSSTRRWVTAATAGGLGFLGSVLGIVAAYAGLAAGYSDELHHLSAIPYKPLAVMVLGMPMIACFGSWLMAGSEPQALARQPIE